MMLSALHVLTAQGLLQAGWKVAVPWPVHSRLRSSSSTSAAVDGAPVVIVAEVAKFRFFREKRVTERTVSSARAARPRLNTPDFHDLFGLRFFATPSRAHAGAPHVIKHSQIKSHHN
jgi:hypothetical protein